MSNCKFKTKIGGQAVLEGIAMKGIGKTCLAVRQPDGEIYTEMFEDKRSPLMKIPVLRGPVAMISAMVTGTKYINKSADIAFAEETQSENKGSSDSVTAFLGIALGLALAVGLFVLLPTFLTGLADRYIAPLGGWKSVLEALIKMVVFVLYLFGVTRIKDIRRVFEYHGAEHKTIFCYENGYELTPENAAKCSRFHPRCGTSFLFLVVLISIFISSLIPWQSVLVRSLLKILLLPVTMGLAYEVIQLCGRCDNKLTRILAAPGLWMQRLTTFEPDQSQIEVAITALKAVLPDNPEEAQW